MQKKRIGQLCLLAIVLAPTLVLIVYLRSDLSSAPGHPNGVPIPPVFSEKDQLTNPMLRSLKEIAKQSNHQPDKHPGKPQTVTGSPTKFFLPRDQPATIRFAIPVGHWVSGLWKMTGRCHKAHQDSITTLSSDQPVSFKAQAGESFNEQIEVTADQLADINEADGSQLEVSVNSNVSAGWEATSLTLTLSKQPAGQNTTKR